MPEELRQPRYDPSLYIDDTLMNAFIRSIVDGDDQPEYYAEVANDLLNQIAELHSRPEQTTLLSKALRTLAHGAQRRRSKTAR